MRRPSIRPIALALLLGSVAVPITAQAMALSVNHSARLDIPGTASSVIVGNPAVADVNVVDSHTVYVLGRGVGSTDVIVLDKGGHTLFKGDVTVGASERTVTMYRGADTVSVACNPGCIDVGAKPSAQPDAASSVIGAVAAAAGQGAQSVGSALAPASPPHP